MNVQPHNVFIGILIAAGHWILFAGYSIIFILSNDISILIVITIHLFGILLLNLLFHDCPITLLEDKFLGTTMVDTYSGLITCDFTNDNSDENIKRCRSQTTLQVILIALLLVSLKVTLLLLKHVFHEFLESK
uniref:Uncharacterized protein n=1 Tax=viral metagenome TaxID=1070528 RepID=A0A6C0D3V9_9ZZZZ